MSIINPRILAEYWRAVDKYKSKALIINYPQLTRYEGKIAAAPYGAGDFITLWNYPAKPSGWAVNKQPKTTPF